MTERKGASTSMIDGWNLATCRLSGGLPVVSARLRETQIFAQSKAQQARLI